MITKEIAQRLYTGQTLYHKELTNSENADNWRITEKEEACIK